MKFKGKGCISKQNLCKKDMDASDPLIEESIIISFKAIEFSELAGMSQNEMEVFLGDNENKSFEKGTGSFILSNTFDLMIANRHDFRGVKFSSASIKEVKMIGHVINLRCRIEYTEEIHRELPALLNTVIDIEINSVNE
jgi:hypothetical protein